MMAASVNAGNLPSGLHPELDSVLRSSPLLALLGIELDAWEPGSARLHLSPGTGHANLGGAVHGGILFALADAAFEVACNSYGRVCVAIETACHYSSVAPLGERLVAEATEMSRSRRTASYRIEVRGRAGELRSWYMALAYRTERWHLGEERWPAVWRSTR